MKQNRRSLFQKSTFVLIFAKWQQNIFLQRQKTMRF